MKTNEADKFDNRDNLFYKNKKMIIAGLIIALAVIAVLLIIKNSIANKEIYMDKLEEGLIGKEGEVTTTIDATIEKVIKSAKLYTAEYPYNGYVSVEDEKGNVKYYAAYEGTVKAGIEDVNQIEYSVDTDKKEITIVLPEITVYPPVVNAGTIEYIFTKEKYNSETVAQEAYAKATEDLKEKIDNDKDFLDRAIETAKTTEKAIVEPWVTQIDVEGSYTINILSKEETSKDE